MLIDAGADAELALIDAMRCYFLRDLLPKEQWPQLHIETSDAMRATIVELINVAGARISAVVAFEAGVVSCDLGIVARFVQPAFAEYDLDRGGDHYSALFETIWNSSETGDKLRRDVDMFKIFISAAPALFFVDACMSVSVAGPEYASWVHELVAVQRQLGFAPFSNEDNDARGALLFAAASVGLVDVMASLFPCATLFIENVPPWECFGPTVLHAAKRKQRDAVRFILDNQGAQNAGMDFGLSFLAAIAAGLSDKVTAMIDFDNEIVNAYTNNGYDDWLPLHYAVDESSVSIVKLLLSRGADPRLQCPFNNANALSILNRRIYPDTLLEDELAIVELLAGTGCFGAQELADVRVHLCGVPRRVG